MKNIFGWWAGVGRAGGQREKGRTSLQQETAIRRLSCTEFSRFQIDIYHQTAGPGEGSSIGEMYKR